MFKKENLPFMIIVSICLLGFFLVGGYFAIRFYQMGHAPLYSWSQSPSQLGDLMSSTLTNNEAIYVNDLNEYSMEVENSFLYPIIGRTEGEQVLYAIPGQDPGDYIMLTGLMMPQIVFRNSRLPAFDWRKATFREMRLTTDRAATRQKSTTDAAIIEEMLAALQGRFGNPQRFAADLYDELHLVSDDLPGLIYRARIFIRVPGEVYLAGHVLSNHWYQAGSLLSEWAVR